jgi:hypothetical protein
VGESDVAADVAGERLADGQAHPESLASVALIVAHLVKFIE